MHRHRGHPVPSLSSARRGPRALLAGLAAVLVGVTACSSPSRSGPATARLRNPTVGALAATRGAQGSVMPPRAHGVATTMVPPLPRSRPQPVRPLVLPPLPGEGSWSGAGQPGRSGYAIFTTQLRAQPGLPEAGLALIDPAVTKLVLYAGSAEPYGSWPQQSYVAQSLQPSLIGAFNSGFKIYSYSTGWYDQGRTALPLEAGAASLVIFANGTATVGEWARDVAASSTVVAVRQNLTLLVDHGAPTPQAQIPSDWGAVLGGGATTWRSGIGVTSGGDLVYAAGPDLTPALLAELLVAAGAVRAMQLDINPEWVSFATFSRAGAGGALIGTNLLPGMYFAPSHYLEPYSRDFFAVFAR